MRPQRHTQGRRGKATKPRPRIHGGPHQGLLASRRIPSQEDAGRSFTKWSPLSPSLNLKPPSACFPEPNCRRGPTPCKLEITRGLDAPLAGPCRQNTRFKRKGGPSIWPRKHPPLPLCNPFLQHRKVMNLLPFCSALAASPASHQPRVERH